MTTREMRCGWTTVLTTLLWIATTLSVSSSSTSLLSRCCGYLNRPTDLFACVTDGVEERSQQCLRKSEGEPPIHILTFASDNIISYSAYVLLVTAHTISDSQTLPFTIAHENSTRSLTEGIHSLTDWRWAKLPLLLNAMQSVAKDADYLVFLDADVLWRNADFHVRSVIDSYPAAQVIIAKDALDFANSGVMIVRNSEWSRAFLRRWFAMRDSTPNAFCDQHVLNALSLQLRNENQLGNIQLVNATLFNSVWPPTETFTEENVLHLLGEHSSTRAHIGRKLADALCSAHNKQTVEKPLVVRRLNISSRSLREWKFDALSVRVYESLHVVREIDVDQRLSVASREAYRELLHSTQEACDMSIRLQRWKWKSCQAMLHKGLQLLNVQLASSDVAQREEETLFLWERFNDWTLYNVTVTQNIELKQALVEAALHSIDSFHATHEAFSSLRHPNNRVYLHRLRADLIATLSESFATKTNLWRNVIRCDEMVISELSSALSLLQPPERSVKSSSVAFQSVVMQYVAGALRLSEAYQQTHRLSEAKDWVMIAQHNVDMLRQEYSGEWRVLSELTNRVRKAVRKTFASDAQRLQAVPSVYEEMEYCARALPQ